VAVPIQGSGYQVVSIVDLTERIQAERAAAMEDILQMRMEALRQSRESAATIKAQRDELAVANKLYQAELATKRLFVANMSHELRTPLAGILGLSELLLEQKMSPVSRGYISTILRSADALRIVVDDILDFSRMELGKVRLVYEEVDLGDLLSDVLDLLASEAQSSGLVLVLFMEADVPSHIWTDPARLRQVMSNVIANAVKYTHEGEVRVHARRNDAGEVIMDVIDTGIGIAPDALARVMQPFEQEERTYARTYGGTGLGLSITNELLKRMDGRLEVESVVGEGSVFRVCLPSSCARPRPLERPLQGQRAYVVDRVASRLRAMDNTLQRLGAEVITQQQFPQLDGDVLAANLVFVDIGMGRSAPKALIHHVEALCNAGKRVLFCHGHHLAPEERQVLSALPHVPAITRPARLSSFAEVMSRTDVRVTIPDRLPEGEMCVMVVDDNPVNQTIAAKMLERLDVASDLVSDGATAVSLADPSRHLLIMMDIQMPGMDGYETMRRIRSRWPDSPKIYIVAFSAHGVKDENATALQSGFDGFLPKPLTQVDLASVVEDALRHRKMSDGA
jgi:signal transduction histidine kinase/CheY-like chemotaxis protein